MLIVLIYTPSITEVVKLQKKGNKLSLVDNQDVAELMLTMQMIKGKFHQDVLVGIIWINSDYLQHY